jgi:hypothetical protein
MNHHRCRRRSRWGLILAPAAAAALLAVGFPLAARAQVLPKEVVEAANADTPQTTQAIQQYIAAQVKKLTGDNARDRKDARNDLERTASSQTASPSFLSAYAAELGRQLVPVAGNKSVPVRLNAAIASYGVARRSGGLQLADITRKFMSDDAEPVALWGVKAAGVLLPAELRGGGANNKDSLTATILATTERFPDSGAIAEDAYDALTLGIGAGGQPLAGVTPAMIRAVAPKVMDLLQRRVELYKGLLPANPFADVDAGTFLTFQGVWDSLQPPERLRAAQLLNDLIGLGGQQAQAGGADVDPELSKMLQYAGSAVSVLAGRVKDANLQAAGKALGTISPRTTGDDVAKRAAALTAAMEANPQLKGLKPPPKFSPTAAEPAQPATPAEGGGAAQPGNTAAARPAAGAEGAQPQ